jgi:lipopolysaccharide export system protein LptA
LPPPPPLPENVSSTTDGGIWTTTDQKTGCKNYELKADARASADNEQTALTGVKLRIFHKSPTQCDTKFDLVQSDAATFFANDNTLRADGEVDITLGEPAEGEPPPNLIGIHSSGVTFDTQTGKADTENVAKFHFKNGEGQSRGATYDPPSKQLFMKNDVVVDWKAASPHAKPLHIVAPSLYYMESASEIDLIPNGRMTRDELTFEGDKPTIRLRDDGAGHKFVREIDADHARGSDNTPGRKLNYSADKVWVFYNDDHLIERIMVEGHAAMTSTSLTSQTDVTAHHVEMYFNPHDNQSELDHVVCSGNAVVNSKPLAIAGKAPADAHVLRSENIDLKMRPGGRDIQTVSAHPSGTLEFMPGQPASHHRTLRGDNLLIDYGPQNHIEDFRTSNVTTTTDPNDEERKHNRGVTTTSSKEMAARFEPTTNQLSFLDQTGSFSYQSGERQAHANKATFDQKQNIMNLDGKAVVIDSNGTTSADHIRLDQNTDEFVAENVTSSRAADSGKKSDSSVLSSDSPMNAQARRMESSNRAGNHRTRYEGNARIWQGANRISADVIEIDRIKKSITADGNVVTEAWETPKDDGKKKADPILTKVYAPHLIYTDSDKLAFYSGGVKLERPTLHLKSKELHTWLADSKSDSQLDKAFADGAVEISGTRRDIAYTGTSEHMEYYTDEQKVILSGGKPKLVRTVAGKAPTVLQEQQLIYFVNDGKLTSVGAGSDRIPRKK